MKPIIIRLSWLSRWSPCGLSEHFPDQYVGNTCVICDI